VSPASADAVWTIRSASLRASSRRSAEELIDEHRGREAVVTRRRTPAAVARADGHLLRPDRRAAFLADGLYFDLTAVIRVVDAEQAFEVPGCPENRTSG
jgi:hypothetical protein